MGQDYRDWEDSRPTASPIGMDPKTSDASLPKSIPADPPVREWDRYQLSQCLGEGGMGRVFKGFDTRLNRHVAIKFLKEQNHERTSRFIREARAQARVEHVHVCKIHEVGEVEGHPYIAMQYLAGKPLSLAATSMTLEDKLQVVKKVAEALHEAHCAGLIHRDLKPGNIMVVDGDDGVLKPYVMDFGLAHFGTDEHDTVEGSILGTPSFMAPEQVRGDISQLDRRTDVYGLGATLYDLLTGCPPFTGSSQAALFRDILEADVEKPSRKQPGIPRDVETIVLKALEKEPQRRYPSADAFAQDLTRYLQGEPIQAQPARWPYVLKKKIVKHKWGFSLGTLATLLLLLTFSWGLVTRLQASAREKLIRESTAQAKEIEGLARLSSMSPAHDLRPDQERLRGLLQVQHARLSSVGRLGKGPTHYALGVGYLALNDWESARHHLELAWQKGYQDGAVAYALGLVFCELFREHLAQIQLIDDDAVRARKRQELQADYRDPALEYLKRVGRLEMGSPSYLAALIAFCEDRLEDALASLQVAQKEQPWLFEVHRLEGDLYRDLARQKGEAGEREAAMMDFEKSLASYRQAALIAQSDPQTFKHMGLALILMMQTEMFHQSDLELLLSQGIQLTDQALALLPEDDAILRLRARLYRAIAQNRRIHDDPRTLDYLTLAERAARKAIEWNPAESQNYLQLGLIYWALAKWQEGDRVENGTSLEQALQALAKVEESHRDDVFFFTQGQIHKSLANAQVSAKQDPCDQLANAVAAFSKAIALEPVSVRNYNSLANAYLAMDAAGGCPNFPKQELQDKTVAVLDQAIAYNPQHPVLLYQAGRAYQRRASGDLLKGWQLDADLAALAIDRYSRARACNPDLWFVYNGLGWVQLLQAQSAVEEGADPTASFAEAVLTFRKGRDLASGNKILRQNQAWVHYYNGKFSVRSGNPDMGDLDHAIAISQEGLATYQDLNLRLCLASAFRMKGEALLESGGDPSTFLQSGIAHCQDMLKTEPKFPEAYRTMGLLWLLQAQWQQFQGVDPAPSFQAAELALSQALEHQPDGVFFHLALAKYWLLRSGEALHREASAADFLAKGLEATEDAFALRPGFAETEALQLCLLRLQERADQEEGDPSSLADLERRFQAVIQARPHLRHVFSRWFSL